MPESDRNAPSRAQQQTPPAPGTDAVGSATPAGGDFSDSNEWAPAAHHKPLGARVIGGGRCEFRVWAPDVESVELRIVAPSGKRVTMTKQADGYHEATVECGPGTRYLYVLDGDKERPDPASRLQPEGVHASSEVVADDFSWSDKSWKGLAPEDYVVYELHIGTFTPEGTFDAAVEKLDALSDLGVTVVELLPVAQFPGGRNWGYDGTYVGAAQNTYGGPQGLKRLVDACHARGLAIVLDVVYNHLGPEGNYLSEYGPYFTDRYKTPWGLALNFDGPHSDFVRWFFIHNALQWIDEFHFDGLRVDAVHAIVDHTAEPFLQDMNAALHTRAAQLGRRVVLIAESDLNDPRVITPRAQLGLGFDSQWNDDFHHTLHVLLTGERDGYYVGYEGVSDLASVMRDGYLYTGQHSSYRGRKYGLKPATRDGSKFVVCAQNHDQVGNRMMGDRIADLVTFEKVKVAAAAVVLSPFIPMLFMGEEYGEKAPFQYFTSHGDEALIAAVRKGRLEEFDDFAWEGDPPDPDDQETFARSKLKWDLVSKEEHSSTAKLYRQLLRIRREVPAFRTLDLLAVETHADDAKQVLAVLRRHESGDALLALNFSDAAQVVELPFDFSGKALIETGVTLEGRKLTLSGHSFAVFG